MAIILTNQGRLGFTRSIYRDIANNNDYYYLVLGKTTPWDDEQDPDIPVDCGYTLKQFRQNILFGINIGTAEICQLARRIDWEDGTIYDQYDDSYGRLNKDVFFNPLLTGVYQANSGAVTLNAANFYVITDEFKVYKCLSNNNNAPSTVKPTYTSTDVAELNDGYKWKFMFQVSSSDQTRFLDDNYIPVRKFTAAPYGDVNGEIDSVTLDNGGLGYTNAIVSISGDGQGATASATISSGIITEIVVNNVGSGYSFAIVTITGDGSGAVAYANVGSTDILPSLQSNVESTAISGTIDRIDLIDSGENYGGDVAIKIVGDGQGAEASVTVRDDGSGEIEEITVTNNGSGYTFAEIVFTQSASGVGSGATARAILSPIKGHGAHPINELYANKLAISLPISENNNTDLFLNNDFRQIGLIKNIQPYNAGGSEVFSEPTGTTCFVIDVASTTPYNVDDIITTTEGGKFRVVQIASDGVHLQPIIGLISNSSVLTNITTPATNLTINSVTEPEIDITTGDIVYIENRLSINRQTDQVETIKSVLTF